MENQQGKDKSNFDLMAEIILVKALRENKASELLDKLFDGYGVTIDAETKQFVYAKFSGEKDKRISELEELPKKILRDLHENQSDIDWYDSWRIIKQIFKDNGVEL